MRRAVQLMSKQFDYLVVGGGNAAGYACREFVAQGVAANKVAVVTAEPVPPYERPALTKAYLHPPSAKVRARLPGFHTCVGGGGERQTTEWYAEKGISLIHGRASAVDFASKAVTVEGEKIQYDKLILATGCRPVRMSQFGIKGDDLQNVCYLREEKDAAGLVATLEALGGGGKAVVVGGGYIGLECAAALVGWGVDTTVVFPEAHCCSRLFSPELAQWMEEQYAARGVKFVKGDVVAEFLGEGGKLTGVTLQSGTQLDCNVSVVGIGAAPNVEFFEGLKLEQKAVAVDANMRTSSADVYAVGDIATFPSKYGGLMRCESVDHARKSASQAVKAAMGVETGPYAYLPYYYTRVFEYTDSPIVFNFFGDQTEDVRVAKFSEKSIGAIWVREGKVVGVLLMGSPGPSAEDQAKLRKIAETCPEAASVEEVFKAAGF